MLNFLMFLLCLRSNRLATEANARCASLLIRNDPILRELLIEQAKRKIRRERLKRIEDFENKCKPEYEPTWWGFGKRLKVK